MRPGELVRVRSAEEIVATLDEDGRLDGLPFMPEMLAACGRTLPVLQTAAKTCDGSGLVLGMSNAVFLAGSRCDGSAHGGCQAACALHWKEAWLERVGRTSAAEEAPPSVPPAAPDPALLARLAPTTKPPEDGVTVYSCQATEIFDATVPLSPWDLGQYAHDIRNWGVRKLAYNLVMRVINKYQRLSRRAFPRWLRIRGGETYPLLRGELDHTPTERLDLQPGDHVRIKSREEIVATLDRDNRNRGLAFDVEELRFCGQTARVLARVERLINERTGRMMRVRSDCLVLEGVACPADYHKLCARGIYSFWREIWLEKIP